MDSLTLQAALAVRERPVQYPFTGSRDEWQGQYCCLWNAFYLCCILVFDAETAQFTHCMLGLRIKPAHLVSIDCILLNHGISARATASVFIANEHHSITHTGARDECKAFHILSPAGAAPVCLCTPYVSQDWSVCQLCGSDPWMSQSGARDCLYADPL